MKTAIISPIWWNGEHSVTPADHLSGLLKHTPEPFVIFAFDMKGPKFWPSLIVDPRIIDTNIYDQASFGYLTGAWNTGAAMALAQGCDRVIWINDDVLVGPSWREFCEAITEPMVAYGPLTDEPGTGGAFGQRCSEASWAEYRALLSGMEVVRGLNGFCWGMTRETIATHLAERTDLFNPLLPFGGNDEEFCRHHERLGGTFKVVRSCWVHHDKQGRWREFDEAARERMLHGRENDNE